jgi:hypothetical protein
MPQSPAWYVLVALLVVALITAYNVRATGARLFYGGPSLSVEVLSVTPAGVDTSIRAASTSTPIAVASTALPLHANSTLGPYPLSPLRPRASIALLVMLPDTRLEMWAAILGAMQSNPHVEAFFLMWQNPMAPRALAAALNASRGALMSAWHAPSTTWTTGRNTLAQAAYAAEVARGARFRYWAFFDEETLSCLGCPDPKELPDRADHPAAFACCLDFIVSRGLLAPYRYAVYAMSINTNKRPVTPELERSFREWDCPDAKVAAMHRDAVPVLLPYSDHFDSISWHASQNILQ